MLLKKHLTFVISLITLSGFSQTSPTQTGTVSSMMNFEGYPVELSTGIPQISIPLYNLPTRASDVNVGLELSYHPSSVALIGGAQGNVGTGWSVSGAGVIGRDASYADEIAIENTSAIPQNYEGRNIYQFNFLGFSGKFRIKKSGDELLATLFENKGKFTAINVNYTSSIINTPVANGTHSAIRYSIIGFTLTDTDGKKYLFNTKDNYVYETFNPQVTFSGGSHLKIRRSIPTSFHLSEIRDANNNILVNYNYTFIENVEAYHQAGESNTSRVLSSIVTAHGVIDFVPFIDYVDNHYRLIRYNRIFIRSLRNYGSGMIYDKVMRRFDFTFDLSNNLTRVDLSDDLKQKVESYHLYYWPELIGGPNPIQSDSWGYKKVMPLYCENTGSADPIYSVTGSLSHMVLPTGGCVSYGFEVNNYSFYKGKALDIKLVNNIEQVDDNFYKRITAFPYGTPGAPDYNYHNYNTSSRTGTGTMSATNGQQEVVGTFTIWEQKSYNIQFTAPQYLSESLVWGQEYSYRYPTFTLHKVTAGVLGPVLATYTGNDNYYNNSNSCRGSSRIFEAGNYAFKLLVPGNVGDATGSVSLTSYTIKPDEDIKKFWYGGGIRIGSIKYFRSRADALDFGFNPDIQPLRTISYDYSLFDDPQRSSGSVGVIGGTFRPKYNTHVYYKNITVRDSKIGGRSEYTYFVPDTDYGDADDRIKLTQIKEYNDNGKLLARTDHGYNLQDVISIGDPDEVSLTGMFGWTPLLQTRYWKYFGSNYISSTEEYNYNGPRQIQTVSRTSSDIGGVLRKKHLYDYRTSANTAFRSKLEFVEHYRDDELLAVEKTEYTNNWQDPYTNTVINTAYLPQAVKTAKGNGPLEDKAYFSLYDKYGNILQMQQANGMKTAYIRGYNDTQIIAKIENITAYTDIPETLLSTIKTHSDTGTEIQLLSSLNTLRSTPALANCMITTYTYKPLIGISTETDIRGRRTTYTYDVSNRLEKVTDHDGNILTETQHKLKTQN